MGVVRDSRPLHYVRPQPDRRLPGFRQNGSMVTATSPIKRGRRRLLLFDRKFSSGKNHLVNDPSDQGYLAIKAVMMPRDTNPYGTIFGGVTMSYIDQAGDEGQLRTSDRSLLQNRGGSCFCFCVPRVGCFSTLLDAS